MQRPLRTLLCLLPLALAACETSVPPEQASNVPPPAPAAAPAAPVEVATAPAPTVAEAPAPTPAAPPADPAADGALPDGIAREAQPLKTIGVVACDSYVEAVRACLNDGHIVGGARVKVRSALAKQIKSWSDGGKKPDIDACVAARGEARTQLKQYGCSNL